MEVFANVLAHCKNGISQDLVRLVGIYVEHVCDGNELDGSQWNLFPVAGIHVFKGVWEVSSQVVKASVCSSHASLEGFREGVLRDISNEPARDLIIRGSESWRTSLSASLEAFQNQEK